MGPRGLHNRKIQKHKPLMCVTDTKSIVSVLSSCMMLKLPVHDEKLWSRYQILQNGNIFQLYQYLSDQCKTMIHTTLMLCYIPGNVWHGIPIELYQMIYYHIFQG